jgi:hypothetical protein
MGELRRNLTSCAARCDANEIAQGKEKPPSLVGRYAERPNRGAVFRFRRGRAVQKDGKKRSQSRERDIYWDYTYESCSCSKVLCLAGA